jgi:cell division protein FtsL
MKKISIITLIISLILFTAFVKNSTKRIDDKIFSTNESIRGLKMDYDELKLEYDYLSSADKLIKFQNLYFENELIKKDIQNIKVIEKSEKNLVIKQLKFFNE